MNYLDGSSLKHRKGHGALELDPGKIDQDLK